MGEINTLPRELPLARGRSLRDVVTFSRVREVRGHPQLARTIATRFGQATPFRTLTARELAHAPLARCVLHTRHNAVQECTFRLRTRMPKYLPFASKRTRARELNAQPCGSGGPRMRRTETPAAPDASGPHEKCAPTSGMPPRSSLMSPARPRISARAADAEHFLAEASALLAESFADESALARVARAAVPAIADWCAFYLVGASPPGVIACVAQARVEGAQMASPPRPLRHSTALAPADVESVVRTGIPELSSRVDDALLCSLVPDPAERELLRAQGPRSYICAPLRARGNTLGALALLTAGSGRRFGAVDLRLAEQLASRAAVAVDNTRLYQQAQAAVRAREEFLSVASHELKTPLTALRLTLDNLLRSARRGTLTELGPEHLIESLETATHQAGRLSLLVGNLLDVSQIDAGRLRIEPEDLDLAMLARDVVVRLAAKLAHEHCPVQVSAQGETRGRWDRLGMERVLTNLLGNAMKYGLNRPVFVHVEGRDATVVLVVRDDGIGIPPERLGRIFERFERAVPAANYSGLGLGLYITRQIVLAHGGDIVATSEPRSGTTFTVTLPRVTLTSH